MDETSLLALGRSLALDLVAITILAYAIYFRRHRRRDLLLGYVALNVSLFAVAASLAAAGPLSVGVGFGLFAVLSIVRLRSDETTQEEIGYTLVSLVLGLLLGLPGLSFTAKVLFAITLIGVMYVVDHPRLLPPTRHQRHRVVLEAAYSDPALLRHDLEERLGATVNHLIVQEIDYVRDTTTVDVRVTRGRAAAARTHARGFSAVDA